MVAKPPNKEHDEREKTDAGSDGNLHKGRKRDRQHQINTKKTECILEHNIQSGSSKGTNFQVHVTDLFLHGVKDSKDDESRTHKLSSSSPPRRERSAHIGPTRTQMLALIKSTKDVMVATVPVLLPRSPRSKVRPWVDG